MREFYGCTLVFLKINCDRSKNMNASDEGGILQRREGRIAVGLKLKQKYALLHIL